MERRGKGLRADGGEGSLNGVDTAPRCPTLPLVQVRLSTQSAAVVKTATTTNLVLMHKRSNAFVVDELLKESPTYQKLLASVQAQAPKRASR